MKTRAAVLWEAGSPVEIVDVELAPPGPGEVLVEVAAAGVCGTDLHVVDGELPEPFPIVLGHEGAGEVMEAGPGVTSLEPGDHVVLSLVPPCGECAYCRDGRPVLCEQAGELAAAGTLADGTTRLSVDGTRLHHFNQVSCFADHVVVPSAGAVRVRDDVDLRTAALVSCAVLTGTGAVWNTAGVGRGASVAVWGCGGVGLNVVQAARIAGAEPIVAVDVVPEKLELARRLGATAVVDATAASPHAAVQDLTRGGVDYAFEALGREETIQAAWAATRPGGTTVVVGLVPKGRRIEIDPWQFISEKTLKGCFLGSPRIDVDIPRLLDLYAGGDLRLDELVSHRLPLEQLPQAFERLRAGTAARQLVVFETGQPFS